MSGSRVRWTWQGVAVVVAAAVVLAWGAYLVTSTPTNGSARGEGAPLRIPKEPEQTAVLWIGDSYTAGVGAVEDEIDPSQGEACLTADRMGWWCNLDAQGGTGYINNGHNNSPDYLPVPKRMKRDADYLADVIVLDAGRNDYAATAAELRPAVEKTLDQLKEMFPKGRIVFIAPYGMGAPSNAHVISELHRIARERHLPIIDPQAEGWVKPGRMPQFTTEDGTHPNGPGHRYIAQHLASRFRDLGLDKVRPAT